MGSFTVTPEAGKRYFVQTTNNKGKQKRVELPKAHPDAYSLKVGKEEHLVEITALSNHSSPNKPLYLLIHTGGLIQHLSLIEYGKPQVFDERNFPASIHQAVLIDPNYNILSERLVFFRNEIAMPFHVKMDKETYGIRDKIKLACNVDLPGAKKGNFSISVIDGLDVQPDLSSNILTQLLLTSELKGYIENPAYYFSAESDAAQALDLVMMTYGWRRYDMQQVLKGNLQKPAIKPEGALDITGTVGKIGLFRTNPLKNGKVRLFIPQLGIVEEVTTQDDGRFEFSGYELADSIRYIIQAFDSKEKDLVELKVNEETFPTINKKHLIFPDIKINHQEEYQAKALDKYIIDHGMRMIQLKEVEVVAQRRQRIFNAFQTAISSRANRSFDTDYIEEYGLASVLDVVQRAPGIMVRDDNAYFMSADKTMEGNTPYAALILDGVYMYPDDHAGYKYLFSSINIQDVERVEIVRSSEAAALFGSRGGSGVIAVTSKRGINKMTSTPKLNIHTLIPLGYQTPIEFYSPKYETIEAKNYSVPDLRTTIYWNPAVELSTEGKASVEFYSADNISTYYIIAEGLMDDGTILHSVSTVDIR